MDVENLDSLRGWFGEGWGGPICERTPHVPAPVGEVCLWCEESIAADDRGIILPVGSRDGWAARPIHLECQMRSVLGGINHQTGDCACCGGTEPPDPPGLSRREAALAAVGWSRAEGSA